MIHITRAQMIVISIVLFLGVLFSVPNFLPASVRAFMPSWFPSSTINLGLDLQGGSYLLLEVDMPGVVKERLETVRDDIRTLFRRDRVLIDNNQVTRDGVN